ncbi:HD-GYP domain-containing protein [Rhodopirellula sp. MGV]|uniref:HD-GYP domain-containing protein n=1 Tax=Rhodopirellula sp. MGV TaxID=2023130 RepID=UPI000B965BB1|nr:HD domain-containing phosphohydrolase [Rhodopirellula sp. MGV]OYP34058.1 hypothetical protein CGZ80_16755 [Rhodopirellula sp. MGV]
MIQQSGAPQPDESVVPTVTGGTPSDLDHFIAMRIANEIGYAIHLFQSADEDAFAQQTLADPSRVHSVEHEGHVRQGLVLPQGSVAVWQCEANHAKRVGNHALAILQLVTARHENKQLLSEVDSLTNQVMQDFEELSLIRTLASSLELPQSAEEIDTFVISSLRPLAGGVGAQSMAAVLMDEHQMRSPLWTNAKLLEDQVAWDLIEQLRNETSQQPVVRNVNIGSIADGGDAINELVMVECSSEGRLHGWVIACNRIKDEMDDLPWAQLGFTTVQASLMETVSNQLASQLNNIRLLRQKEELFTDVIRALVNAVEARDPYTCGHSERVACFARLLASKIGFSAIECERIYLTGLLHDVGKIAIPDGVLQKPNALNDEERAIIETHTDSGWRILQELDALQDILPGVLYHHEHWDGGGYPDKLVGENIPIDGRILASATHLMQ